MPFGLHTFQPPQAKAELDRGARLLAGVAALSINFLRLGCRHPLGVPFAVRFVLLAVDQPGACFPCRHRARSGQSAHASGAA